MGLIKFATGTVEKFNALATKNDDTLYFLTDSMQLYKGANLFCNSFKVVNGTANAGYEGVLYVDKATSTLKVYENGKWADALDAAVINTVDATKVDKHAVSSEAVVKYVTDVIDGVTGGVSSAMITSISTGSDTGYISVQKGAGTNEEDITQVKVNLKDIPKMPVWEESTRTITFPNYDGKEVIVNLGKDMVVTDASYDHSKKEISLVVGDNDKTITIPVGDLVDIYTHSDDHTGAVKVTIAENKVKAEVVVDGVTIKNDGGTLKADFSTLALKTEVKTVADDLAALGKEVETIDGELELIDGKVSTHAAEIANIKADYATKAYVEGNYATTTQLSSAQTTLQNNINAVSNTLNTQLTWGAIA